ncbi:hypothetical protein [Shewanella sp. GXUN23E]|uniref:hypothetical protein n=1 Tax=Shewanella sp. GXUN23E TaxID=3422498 RepID=UPI003D7E745E
MKPRTALSLMCAGMLCAPAVMAAGPLYLTDGANPQPFKWDTSRGPIPVYTDGGGAFTYDFDGVTPFITIERANEVTAQGFAQWSAVATSTFAAAIAGTIESQTGVADVTAANAADFYTRQNGYGFWVLYDTDGSIMEDFFGVNRNSVLGIAFPEWVDEDGTIVEATALINGWAVRDTDPHIDRFAGVFTHEFGHAINLSHSQTNGRLVYESLSYRPLTPGVAGCVDPVYSYRSPVPGFDTAMPEHNETMYPFINVDDDGGAGQSSINMPDDIAAISDIYPTAAYLASRGSIEGVLRLKDGVTEFSGINVIARNIDDPLGDTVSGMTGAWTQGKIGPDGHFRLGNLTPGARYVVYLDQIVSGGYPTTPMQPVSELEYWNAAESNDPVADTICDATPITAEAGTAKQADIYWNGYTDGIQYTPLVAAFVTDLSKNGKVAVGTAGSTPFKWDRNTGFSLLGEPGEFSTSNVAIDAQGVQFMVGGADPDGNGIGEPAIYQEGAGTTLLGDLNGNRCGGSSTSGSNAAVGWAMDDYGRTVVGMAYVDADGDGSCQRQDGREITAYKWTPKTGMQPLPTDGLNVRGFTRAQGVSGDGQVVLGINSFGQAIGWYRDRLYDLYALTGATDAYANNRTGTKAALSTRNGIVLWNPKSIAQPFTDIGGLKYCYNIPYSSFGRDFCAMDLNGDGEVNTDDWDYIFQQVGAVPTLVFDMSDDGDVMIGRAGSFLNGFYGALYLEGIGWMDMDNFLEKQGVVEARRLGLQNPLAVDGKGNTLMGGLPGSVFTWLLDMEKAFVCRDGRDLQVSFPNQLIKQVKRGALLGRCNHQG